MSFCHSHDRARRHIKELASRTRCGWAGDLSDGELRRFEFPHPINQVSKTVMITLVPFFLASVCSLYCEGNCVILSQSRPSKKTYQRACKPHPYLHAYAPIAESTSGYLSRIEKISARVCTSKSRKHRAKDRQKACGYVCALLVFQLPLASEPHKTTCLSPVRLQQPRLVPIQRCCPIVSS